jgi:hypothetical protein
MGSPVQFVPDPRRKKKKQDCLLLFATQFAGHFVHFFFATPHLQHQIDRQWQMAAFYMPNNRGNSNNQTGWWL